MIPCKVCNDIHKGAQLHHMHEDAEGVGYVRRLVIGGVPEFCWRCSCHKSGWVNVPNEVSERCADRGCVCHTADRAS